MVCGMKFGIAFANTGPFTEAEGAVAVARAAEAAGFESLWTVEHVVVPAGYAPRYPYDPSGRMPGGEDAPLPDPLVWLAYVAAATSTINLATGIVILPQRNPVVLAKEAATLDRMSGGRLLLGIGVGWLEEEFRALGVPFEGRGRRTDEYVGAMRALWTEEKASYDGEFAAFSDCILRPQPSRGIVPIHVGGHTNAAAERAGRLGDGFFPARGTHEELAALFDRARATAVEHGRDPDALEISTGGNGALGSGALDEVKALADLGVARVMLPAFVFARNTADSLARYGDEVISKAADLG
jgi:probable F420-dependent oxidoreductase